MAESLSEIFAKDPLSLTRENIQETIKFYREKRAQFNLGEKVAKPKAVKGEKQTSLDLDELLS